MLRQSVAKSTRKDGSKILPRFSGSGKAAKIAQRLKMRPVFCVVRQAWTCFAGKPVSGPVSTKVTTSPPFPESPESSFSICSFRGWAFFRLFGFCAAFGRSSSISRSQEEFKTASLFCSSEHASGSTVKDESTIDLQTFRDCFNPSGESDQFVVHSIFAEIGWAKRS